MSLRPLDGRQRLELSIDTDGIDSTFAGEPPTARRRRGASRSTPDARSSSAADEASEAMERAVVAMVA